MVTRVTRAVRVREDDGSLAVDLTETPEPVAPEPHPQAALGIGLTPALCNSVHCTRQRDGLQPYCTFHITHPNDWRQCEAMNCMRRAPNNSEFCVIHRVIRPEGPPNRLVRG